MSIWKPWLFVLALAVAGCGGDDGDGGGGGGDMPDAGVDIPDAPVPDAGEGEPDARIDPSLCESYCATVMANCSGDNAQYADMDSCVSSCTSAGWREGDEGDDTGNSLYFRLHYADAPATADPQTNCPSAGVTGGGQCGSLCENYCFFGVNSCTDLGVFENLSQCVTTYDDLLALDGASDSTDSNTVQCRINFALKASQDGDPAASCAASDIHGNNVCGSWCEVYCDLMETNCSDQPSAYPNRDTCLTTCADFADDGVPAQNPGEAMGDTVQCRIDHAGVPAARDKALSCGHAAADPTNFCIDVIGPS